MGSEVLIVVHEVGLVLPVDELTGLLHILSHAWRATAKHPDLSHLSSGGGGRGSERTGLQVGDTHSPGGSCFSSLPGMTRGISPGLFGGGLDRV